MKPQGAVANSTVVLAVCDATGVSWTLIDNGDGTRSFQNVHSGCFLAGDNHLQDVWACVSKSKPGWFWRLQPIH
jgi:hypothetical protein